jgi:ribonuclease D
LKVLEKSSVVTFDCEWKASYTSDGAPASGKLEKNCALLQLASSTHVIVIDMLVPHIDVMKEALTRLMASSDILKIGFDVKQDLQALALPHIRQIVDLQCLVRRLHQHGPKKMSLSTCCAAYLGRPLDKRVRMSNWHRRPLTQMQFEYAALDALSLVLLYDRFHQEDPTSLAAAVQACRFDKTIPK